MLQTFGMRVSTISALLICSISASLAAIPLNSPTTDWFAITYIGASRTDFLGDQQATAIEGDLVGSAVGATPIQTAFYFDYDGTSIGFRVRVDGDSNPPGYTGAIWVGMMLDSDNSVDLFAGMIYGNQNNRRVGFFAPGNSLNTSPSTTSISSTVGIYQENISVSNYLWTPVTVGASGNDPVVGGINDISVNGSVDYFATWILPFSELQAAAATRGFTGITQNSTMRFVVGTSQQDNSINQDLNGTSGNLNSSSTWTQLGAVSPLVTALGGVVPEPGTVTSIIVALGSLALMRRRIRAQRDRK